MNKKINVKPVDYLEFEFPDKSTRRAKFTSLAFAVMQEEFGSVSAVLADAQKNPFTAVSRLLYGGMRACDDTVTLTQVEAMVSDFDVGTLSEVLEFLQVAVSDAMSTETIPLAAEPMNRKNRRASQRSA